MYAQGRMHLAWDYLHMVADHGNVALLELRERIYNTGSADIPQDAPPPMLPYQQESVVPQAAPAGIAAKTTPENLNATCCATTMAALSSTQDSRLRRVCE